MREADAVPACFEAESGDFDHDEVEAFFAARRGVLMDTGKDVSPLVPLSKLSPTVQRRWREYLRKKADAETPMNGVRPKLTMFKAKKSED